MYCLNDDDNCLFFKNSLEYKVKKKGWGGGGSRKVEFKEGQSQEPILTTTSSTLTVTIAHGLPSSTSMYLFITFFSLNLIIFMKTQNNVWNNFTNILLMVYVIYSFFYFIFNFSHTEIIMSLCSYVAII